MYNIIHMNSAPCALNLKSCVIDGWPHAQFSQECRTGRWRCARGGLLEALGGGRSWVTYDNNEHLQVGM